MDLQSLFLENPLKLYLLLGLIEVILAACWYARRNPRLLYALIAPPVLAVTIGIVAHCVVTDREQIAQAMGEIGEGVCHNCLAPASRYLDPSYNVPLPLPIGGTLNRDQLLGLANVAIQNHHVSDISFGQVETKIAGHNATTLLETRVSINEGSFYISWKLQWAKRPDGWRIVRLEITKPEYLAGPTIPT